MVASSPLRHLYSPDRRAFKFSLKDIRQAGTLSVPKIGDKTFTFCVNVTRVTGCIVQNDIYYAHDAFTGLYQRSGVEFQSVESDGNLIVRTTSSIPSRLSYFWESGDVTELESRPAKLGPSQDRLTFT